LFTYNSTAFTDTEDINGDIFNQDFYPWLNGTTFGIIVLEDADNSISETNPVINSGDHVFLTLDIQTAFGSGGFDTRTDVFGQIIPEEGSAGVISFTTPAA
jgi:flagellin FlaB